jgi:hypothetical protein
MKNAVLWDVAPCANPHGATLQKTVFFNIKMDLGEIEGDIVDWIDLAQNREKWRAPANAVMNVQVP